MDKYKELSKQLRYCGDEGKCQSCEFYRETEPCSQNLLDEAADAIEELLKASEKPTGLLPVGTDLDDIVDLGEYFFSINSNMEEKVNDSISRQAAIDALRLIPYDLGKRELEDAIKAVEQLPSAQPERKKGKWIYGEDEYGIDGYHCDKCGFFVPWDYAHTFINYIEDYNFCPNCGADMRGEQDG